MGLERSAGQEIAERARYRDGDRVPATTIEALEYLEVFSTNREALGEPESDSAASDSRMPRSRTRRSGMA